MPADLDALERMAEWFTHGHSSSYDAHATLVRTAIAELRSLRTRPVSCEACNGMAKRVAVLSEECRAAREVLRAACRVAWVCEESTDEDIRNLVAARLATDENGGLGA